MKNNSLYKILSRGFLDTLFIFRKECTNVFKDSGVVLIFFVAGIAYPLLYNYVYYHETVDDIPIAIIDESCSSESRDFSRKLDATKELKTVFCSSMSEAENLLKARKVHAIVLFPADYHIKLINREQAYISIYNNMSCFLVYKTITMGINHVMLDETKNIQIERYSAKGITGERADQLVTALPYQDIALYNPGYGFGSFFLPALLIVIIHQTLFFGIGMLTGTAREENRSHQLFSSADSRKGIFRVVLGKAGAYLFFYMFLTIYITILIPMIFNLPHIGKYWDICKFMLPFLLATIFFSMTAAVFVKNRETGMVTFLFFSVILLFLSGFTWTSDYMPAFWKYLSYLFPSTFGVEGYIKINNMGADLGQIKFEYWSLWLQTGIYALTASMSSLYLVKSEKKL